MSRLMSRLRQRLETPRLALRRHRKDDAAAIAEALQDWEVARWLARLPSPYTKSDALEWIGVATRNWNQGRDYQFVVCDRAAGDLIGHMGLRLEGSGTAEFGYWFARQAWGRGFATEAARAVLDFGFRDLALDRIEALVIPENGRSVRVLEKLDMVPVDRRQQRFDPIDATLEVPVYAIGATDWRDRVKR
ncbi:MAG: GNAT family N-acetyltransferase [Azospirillaceae bacterium]